MELGHQAWWQAQLYPLLHLLGLSSGFLKNGSQCDIWNHIDDPFISRSIKIHCYNLDFDWLLYSEIYTFIIWKTLAVCMCLCLNSQYWHILLNHIKSHVSISLPRLHPEVVWARETVSLAVAGTSFPKFIGNGYHQLFPLKWQAVRLVHFPENVFQITMSE